MNTIINEKGEKRIVVSPASAISIGLVVVLLGVAVALATDRATTGAQVQQNKADIAANREEFRTQSAALRSQLTVMVEKLGALGTDIAVIKEQVVRDNKE